MSESALNIALLGNPNCGKTAIFNALTGSRQKVSNYAGVTVERKEGTAVTPGGLTVRILDLPGMYSLDARSPDEQIARDVLLGETRGVASPDAVLAVADATNLERSLGLVLEIRELGIPAVLALNMMDLARNRGLDLDLRKLSEELRIPVVPTVAVRKDGMAELLRTVEETVRKQSEKTTTARRWRKPTDDEVRSRFSEVDRVLRASTLQRARPAAWTDRLDRVLLHPVLGLGVLGILLALMFQAIFNWASTPADLIEAGVAALGEAVGSSMPDGALKSLLVDGIISGVGSVLVFLPQILLLFLFILVLEDSGYMARAAFLMDRVMGSVGLHGRAFIPLLSSYACAIPGIMATRTIENPRDRLVTILVVPLTTCSARLPVYSLLIAAFIPNEIVWGPFRLQGLVMFGLYLTGIVAALLLALVLKITMFKGDKPPFLMELPTYKVPSFRNLLMGLLERAKVFLRRAGTVILALSVLVWFLASYPKAPEGASEPAIHYSFAGRIGHLIEPAIRPLGFDWRLGVALIPGFAAREVMVSALATVYAIEGEDEEKTADMLGQTLSKDWSLATALSLLVWYIFALQCLSTLAVTRRETNSWRWPAFMFASLTALAYVSSLLTYRLGVFLGWG